MAELLEGVGHNIRQLREAKGWNQTELGFHADMSPSIISLIENGKRNPSTTTLARLADALKVEVSDLFPKAPAPSPELPFTGLEGERREPEVHASGANFKGSGRLEATGEIIKVLRMVAAGDISLEEGERKVRRVLAGVAA